MIIDSHCHAGPGDGFTGPWDTSAPLGDYLRRCDAAGVTHSVLLPAFHTDYGRANRAVGRLVLGDPDRFFGYAMVHPVADRGRVGQLVREAISGWGACGITNVTVGNSVAMSSTIEPSPKMS